VVYPVPGILLVVLCGTVAIAQHIVKIRHWAAQKLAFLRGFPPFARDVHSHDTLWVVRYAATFTAWAASLAEIVAVDVKTCARRMALTPTRCMSSQPGPAVKDWCRGSRP
jgi:hypothetical protein